MRKPDLVLPAAAFAAAGLVLATGATPSQAASSTASLSSAAPAGTVVTGQVTTGGHPIAGAQVTLVAWPRQRVLNAVPQGGTAPTHVVGSAVSGGSGDYAITIKNWSAVRSFATNGVVNLEVLARWGDYGTVYAFPRKLTASGALAADNEARVPSTAPQRANLGLVLVTARSSTPRYPPCIPVKIKYLGKHWTVVGMTSSKVRKVTMDFDYGTNQNSSLGVGFKSNAGGSWTESGSMSITESGSAGFPTEEGQKTTLDKTKFKYWKWDIPCEGLQVQPSEWASGTDRGHQGVPRATNCDRFAAGSHFSKGNTTAWDFDSGVSISTVIGINLSAQTGYDHDASLYYHFGNQTYLCGRNDDPGGSPGYVVAGLPSR
jgi:hypothetical protein